MLLVVLRLPRDELLLTERVLADRVFNWPSNVAMALEEQNRSLGLKHFEFLKIKVDTYFNASLSCCSRVCFSSCNLTRSVMVLLESSKALFKSCSSLWISHWILTMSS